jgi:hypothetical protein
MGTLVPMTSQPVRPKQVRVPHNYPVVEGNKINRRKRRWMCSCGQENKVKAVKCANCGAVKEIK